MRHLFLFILPDHRVWQILLIKKANRVLPVNRDWQGRSIEQLLQPLIVASVVVALVAADAAAVLVVAAAALVEPVVLVANLMIDSMLLVVEMIVAMKIAAAPAMI